jgi:hypothetical protein
LVTLPEGVKLEIASRIEKHVLYLKSGTYVVVICLFYRVILVGSNRPLWRDKAQKVTSRRLASKTELITLCYVMERPLRVSSGARNC